MTEPSGLTETARRDKLFYGKSWDFGNLRRHHDQMMSGIVRFKTACSSDRPAQSCHGLQKRTLANAVGAAQKHALPRTDAEGNAASQCRTVIPDGKII